MPLMRSSGASEFRQTEARTHCRVTSAASTVVKLVQGPKRAGSHHRARRRLPEETTHPEHNCNHKDTRRPGTPFKQRAQQARNSGKRSTSYPTTAAPTSTPTNPRTPTRNLQKTDAVICDGTARHKCTSGAARDQRYLDRKNSADCGESRYYISGALPCFIRLHHAVSHTLAHPRGVRMRPSDHVRRRAGVTAAAHAGGGAGSVGHVLRALVR